jgi:hypothetical protein
MLLRKIYQSTQFLVASEGWGTRFLELQDSSGTWGGGLYSPKWISTTYSLLTLRRLGLPHTNLQANRGCVLLLDSGFQSDGGIHFSKRKINHSEIYSTGMVLSIFAYYKFSDNRVHTIVQHLLDQQMSDSGWNCRSYMGDTHGSFHTTISVLEGLWEYEKAFGLDSAVAQARSKAHEFLWMHHLYRFHRTHEIFDPKMLRLSFPPRWRYDYLRSLDYFQDCYSPKDERMSEAIKLLISKRNVEGRWLVNSGMTGKIFFELEKAGLSSRMNTLRALRVLRWWDEP